MSNRLRLSLAVLATASIVGGGAAIANAAEWEAVGELELDDSVTAVAAEQKQPVGQLPAQVGLCR
jgi:hypothetical protein